MIINGEENESNTIKDAFDYAVENNKTIVDLS